MRVRMLKLHLSFPMPIIALTIALLLQACAEEEIEPWGDTRFKEIVTQIGEVGESYAVLDICMPMLEADEEAKYELMSEIEADRYTKLLRFDTEQERERVFRFYRRRGGNDEQNAIIERTYYEAYDAALDDITSIQVCIETIKDYANTLIYMRIT